MKQTAVEWLGNELSKYEIHNPISLSNWEILKQLLNQAKQIEMQQIEEAHYDGQLAMSDFGAYRIFSEQYYKETYGEKNVHKKRIR